MLTDCEVPLRTDKSFREKEDPRHHKGDSPLTILPKDLVKCVTLDYMHLICLGVVKKLINLWMEGKRSYRISVTQSDVITSRIMSFCPSLGCDFARKLRGLNDIGRWKATECRNFLLYAGPIVLKCVLREDLYNNFLCLHVALRILCCHKTAVAQNEYAEKLLLYFVEDFIRIYGKENATHNIHGLIHLAQDCKNYGSADIIGAYRYENKLGNMKKLIRKPNLLLPQVHRRIEEMIMHPPAPKKKRSQILRSGPLVHAPLGVKLPQFRNLVFDNFEIKTSQGNNYCMLHDGSIVEVMNIATAADGKQVITGKRFMSMSDFYTHPCPSSNLKIYRLFGKSDLTCWSVDKVACKCVVTAIDDYFVSIPVLHSLQ